MWCKMNVILSLFELFCSVLFRLVWFGLRVCSHADEWKFGRHCVESDGGCFEIKMNTGLLKHNHTKRQEVYGLWTVYSIHRAIECEPRANAEQRRIQFQWIMRNEQWMLNDMRYKKKVIKRRKKSYKTVQHHNKKFHCHQTRKQYPSWCKWKLEQNRTTTTK